ncbi:MAG: hypothetical protein WA004_01145 [Saprospiraceae bacterium]
MKAIHFLLTLMLTIAAGAAFGQMSLDPIYQRAIEQMTKTPESLMKLDTRGEEALLDSVVCESFDGSDWYPYENTYFRYDDQDLLVFDSTVQWSPENGWDPVTIQLYGYTSADELETQRIVTYDTLNNEWLPDTFRIRNVYDDGRLVAVWSETYNSGTGVWVSDFVDSLVYDVQGQVIQRIGYFYDGFSFTPFARMFLGYENGLLVTDLFQISFIGGGDWINFFRTFYTYENGLLASKRTDYYDEASSNFYETDLETFLYDDEDKLIYSENFFWAGEWVIYLRCNYFYSSGIPSGVVTKPLELANLEMANPFPGGTINAPGLEAGKTYEVAVYNAWGQPVYSQRLGGNSWQLPALPGSGHFVLTVSENGRLLGSRKVVAAY